MLVQELQRHTAEVQEGHVGVQQGVQQLGTGMHTRMAEHQALVQQLAQRVAVLAGTTPLERIIGIFLTTFPC